MPNAFDHAQLLSALRSLLESLPQKPIDPATIQAAKVKQLRISIESAIDRLQQFLLELDPIKQPLYVLDPSDPNVVGQLIADTLLVQPRHPLESLPKFYGSGIYALYYKGPFDAYQPIVNTETPIYIGKADPAKHQATIPIEQGTRLWGRLKDHRRSVEAARTLSLDHFECRLLVVKSAWQRTAEIYLVRRFMPVWNNEVLICTVSGNTGTTRKHAAIPGRLGAWATKAGDVPHGLSVEQIKAQIAEHYEKYPPV